MLDGNRVLVVVPARGGSKGLPGKNLRPLAGTPLVAHVATLVAGVPYVDRAVVSTDDPKIASVAREAGLDAPFVRPAELSGDRIGDHAVLEHALTAVEALDEVIYDVVVMLQPTSPLRRSSDVDAVVRKLLEGWDAVWTVSETPLTYHPAKQLTLAEDGSLAFYDPAAVNVVARQQLTPVFHRNGIAYAFSRECLLEQRTILGRRTTFVLITRPTVSIDTLADFDRAACLFADAQTEAGVGLDAHAQG